MTERLDRAIASVRNLDPEAQDRIASAMLSLLDEDEPEEIDPEHLPDVLASLAEADRGEFASDEAVRAIFERLRAP